MSEIAVQPAGAPARRTTQRVFAMVIVAVQALFAVAIAVVANATVTTGGSEAISTGVLLMFTAWFLVDLVLGAAYAIYRVARS